MENWENSIVIFQIFGGLGAFCELYWSTGKKPGNLQEPLLILKWGSEDYNILFSKDLALGKIFTVRTYFENEVFYINVITETKNIIKKINNLPTNQGYYFKSGLYLQQDGNKDKI